MHHRNLILVNHEISYYTKNQKAKLRKAAGHAQRIDRRKRLAGGGSDHPPPPKPENAGAHPLRYCPPN